MQRQINSVMKQQQRQNRDITQSQKRSPVTAHRSHTSHLSDTVKENREKITNIAEDQCRTAEKLQKLESEIERLESFSRRNNLRFFNIPQPTNETDNDCTRTLVRTLNQQLYPLKRCSVDDIERAHRTGSTAAKRPTTTPDYCPLFQLERQDAGAPIQRGKETNGVQRHASSGRSHQQPTTNDFKRKEKTGHAYYKNGRLHTEVRQ